MLVRSKKKILAALAGIEIMGTAAVWSEPRIEGVRGEFSARSKVIISGANFGEKSPGKPYIWADFENGIQPTQSGRKTSWDEIQHMEPAPHGWHGKGARARDDSGDWTFRVDYNSWTKDGQKSYNFKHQRMNFLISDQSQNWKIWRMLPAGDGHYPNIYASSSNGRVYCEELESESGFWGSFNPNTTEWYTEELLVKASFLNMKDGSLTIKINGQEPASGSTMTRSPKY